LNERADVKAPAHVSDAERLAVGPTVMTPRSVFRARPVIAAFGVLGIALLLEVLPVPASLRLLSQRPAPAPSGDVADSEPKPKLEVGEAELPTETRGEAALAPAREQPAPRAGSPIARHEAPGEFADKEPKVPIVDPSGTALDAFFRALDRTRQKQPSARTRIVHFGDSIVASDYVSGTLRRRFQERFGDAGHGFSLIANAWPAYFHNDIERYATAGWKVSRVVGPLADDGMYGLGCVSFRAEKNALARFSTTAKGDFGTKASRFVVFYLKSPGGGSFQVSVDGKPHALVDTAAEHKSSGFFELAVADGPHEFEIFTKHGTSRLFGAVLERDVPGVVLDAIGIQGARIRFLDKQDDAHFAEQLRAREPNLFIYEFGANESADGFVYPMAEYHESMKAVLSQAQRAVPDSSCLVIGAMDRAVKRGEELLSIRVLPVLIEEQRKVAAEVGCGFFDTYAAMGGKGSMATWVRRGLGQADLTHPTAVGSDVIGTWIFRALMQRYSAFVARSNAPVPGTSSPKTDSATSSPSFL